MSSSPVIAAEQGQPSGRRMSAMARVVGVLYAPVRTFEDIARAPDFLAPWVVLVLTSVCFIYAALHRIGAYAIAHQSLAMSGRGRSMDPQQLDTTARTIMQFIPYQMWASPVITLLFLLALAGIFTAAENFLLAQEVKYRSVLAVVSYAWLPLSVWGLLGAAVIYLQSDPTSVQVQNVVGSNPAFYLDPQSTSPAVLAFLSRLDVFAFWVMALLAIGLAKIGRKLTFGSTFKVVLGLWAVWVVLSVGLAAL